MDGVIRAHSLIPARCNQPLQNAGCRIGPVQQAHLPTPEPFACRRRIVDHAGSGPQLLYEVVQIHQESGATRRDRTGDLLITKQSPDRK
jgi:hypothetical protein